MAKDPRRKEALRLLFAGKRPAEVARAVGINRRLLATWFARPDVLARARREFAAQVLDLLPLALDRLKALLDAESEATALAAVKMVVRIAELASASAASQDEVATRLARLLDDVLAEVYGGGAHIDSFAARVKGKDKNVETRGDKGTT